jgi:hypothetical protein
VRLTKSPADAPDAAATVSLRDGSALSVPRLVGLVTDLPLKTVRVGSMVALLVSRSRPFAMLHAAVELALTEACSPSPTSA